VGVDVQVHSFLTSVLDGHEWVTSRTRYVTIRKERPVAIGDPVWTFWRREEFPYVSGIRTPDCPFCSLVTVLTWALVSSMDG
jgi:hypothetical protein